VLTVAASPPARTILGLPQVLWISVDGRQTLAAGLPSFVTVAADLPEERSDGRVILHPTSPGLYQATVLVFGALPVRQVLVHAVPPLSAIPGGQSIGVLLDTGGVLVVGDAAAPSAAARAGLRAGDLITSVDGQPVQSKERLAALIEAAGQAGRSVALAVRRQGGTATIRVHPVRDPATGHYMIGAWVRDGISGIGTLTFYDPARRIFGALGHVVADAASGQPYPVRGGRIVPALVSGLSPGRQGDPGEKIGLFSADARAWGLISANTSVGIFGRLLQAPAAGAAVPIALEDQIRTGSAEMLTVIAGSRVQPFAVDILRVIPQGEPESKGLVLQVTDPRLLQATGGIVQGMSGSPILQDGRLIGAVTHVFVNDPTRGYGVLAIWMAERAGLTPAAG
jgi:stage IV sporulation protein B